MKYNKELNGKQLEQFHTDFNLDGAAGEIYSTASVFLGKKSYLDCLESVDKDGNVIKGFHKRMKGITGEGLEHEAEKMGGYLELYKKLCDGQELIMTLNPFNEKQNKNKVMFEFTKSGVHTRKPFYRAVKY